MGDLLDLRTLGISSNRLVSLPASLGKLALLEFLFANGNRLHSLPAELAGLLNLKKVSGIRMRERARASDACTSCCNWVRLPWSYLWIVFWNACVSLCNGNLCRFL